MISDCWVYILRTSANTLYTGWTNNLTRRVRQHQNKKGAKYTKSFDSCYLVYSENYVNRSEAMKREVEIKKMTKAKKDKLIAG